MALNEEQAKAYMHKLLSTMVAQKGSDLFISADFPPSMKAHGSMTPMATQKLTGEITKTLAHSLMNDVQREEFAKEMECNFAMSIPGIARFRVNVFVQQRQTGMVIRTIPAEIPNFEKMGLPPILKDVIMNKRGLVLLTLVLSLQASYAAPLILLAQNRQADRDRVQFQEDRLRTERLLADSDYLAREIADFLGIPVGQARLRRFPDSEVSFQIDENIRGTDVFIVQPTCSPVDEHIMEMCVMIDAFRRSSASRITAVIPYYGYARQLGLSYSLARFTELLVDRPVCVHLLWRYFEARFQPGLVGDRAAAIASAPAPKINISTNPTNSFQSIEASPRLPERVRASSLFVAELARRAQVPLAEMAQSGVSRHHAQARQDVGSDRHDGRRKVVGRAPPRAAPRPAGTR